MGLKESNLYRDELLCLTALHWSCLQCVSKSTTPSLFCPLALHKDVSLCVSIPQTTQSTFFTPRHRAVCAYWYVVVRMSKWFLLEALFEETDYNLRQWESEALLIRPACSSLISVCPKFSLWHFDGLVTHLQVPTSFWACASSSLSTCMCHSSDVFVGLNMSHYVTLTFTGRSSSACFSHSQSGMRSCRTRPQRTVRACSCMLPCR